MRALYEEERDRFGLIAVGSRDDWLPLDTYPESTTTALRAVRQFLADEGLTTDDATPEEREQGRVLVRDVVDEILSGADPLELKRMKHAEAVFLAVQDDLVNRGVITPETAYERYRNFRTA